MRLLRMTPARWLLLVRAALSTAVFACAALVIDYRNLADATFCGVESSCFKVRSSSVGQKLAEAVNDLIPTATLPGVTLPLFAGLLALTLFLSGKWMVRLLAGASGIGALAALGLVYAQASIDTFCAYCMVVDVSMIVAAVGAIAIAVRVRTDADAEELLGPSMATGGTFPWGLAGALLTMLPFVWAEFPKVDPLPEPIAKLQQPGKLTIVSFTDFECPYCRTLYPTLKDLKTRDDVVFYRYMVPLDGHKGAMPAALAYYCVDEAQRDRIADTLYTVTPEQLGYESVVGFAQLIANANEAEFRKCMTSQEAKDKVAADKKLFDDLNLSGLPSTYVGARMIRGAATDKVMVAARTAGAGLELPIWLMFVAAGTILVGAAYRSSRKVAEAQIAATAEAAEAAKDEAPNDETPNDEAKADDETKADEPKPAKKKKKKKASDEA
jgi:uncharacterized membrane protein